MRRVFLSTLILAVLAVPLARAETCGDLLTDAAVEKALDQIKKESPLAGLSQVNSAKTIADAYLNAPEGKKAEAVAKALAEAGVTMTVTGSAVLILTGKVYVKGVEWTVETMQQMTAESNLCTGAQAGSGVKITPVFETPGAQAIAPGVTCRNFPDWLNTPEKFERFRTFFKTFYSKNATAMGYFQERLDQVWAIIEPAWKAREAERKLKRLAEDLARKLAEQEKAAKEACTPKPPGPLGSDNSDPAKLPEPQLPPGGMLVLTETVVTPHSLDPSISHTAAPQRNTVSAYFGESVCSWSPPPKALLTEEVFGFDFTLSVTSKNQQRYNEQLIVRSGFVNVGGAPNEIAVNVEPGGNGSAKGHLELGAGDLAFAQDYMTWYLQVGGCGGNVDYIYKFKKP